MNAEEKDLLWNVLACPQCLSNLLVKTNAGVKCTSCNTHFEERGNRQIDFRLKKEKRVSIPFVISPSKYKPNEDVFRVLPLNTNYKDNSSKPQFLSKELASYIPRPSSKTSIMLDLGCGDTRHKPNFEQAGFKYVGLDYDSQEATLLGDAHALPFRSGSFEFLFSFAVLEHLRFPFVAVNEAYRVLKPGSVFIGSVAFLEPFHGQSFYHHTHCGLLNCLEHASFNVECISPNPSWDALTAQASMGLFPKMPKPLTKAIVFPLRAIHKVYWKTGHFFNPQAKEITRLLCLAGAFFFVASKD